MAKKEITGVRIKLATPERIREISSGEVKKPETINYRTLRPEKDGLFCERIFGPTRSYECACGKYKRSGPKFKGVVCDRCGVEVADNRVRRERMGHIELAVPVIHIWYLRGLPSRLSLLLGTSAKDLEKVVYFAPTRKNESAWKVTSTGHPDIVSRDEVISESEMKLHAHYDPKFRAEEAFYLESVDDVPIDEGDVVSPQQVARYKSDYGDDSFKVEPAWALTEDVDGIDLKASTAVSLTAMNELVEKGVSKDLFSRVKLGTNDAFIVTAARKLPFEKGGILSRSELNFFEQKYPGRCRSVRYPVLIDDPCYLVIEQGSSPFVQGEVIYDRQQFICGEYDEKFEAGIGADGVQTLVERMDLDLLTASLREEIAESSGQKKRKLVKRLQVAEDFRKGASSPESMILKVLPVIPPDLRPLVQLDGGRFATSDLNDLYRRVINRNNRLRKLQELHAPEIIIRNEKRMLQECVDALIDNGRMGKAVLGAGNRPLKSLTDLLRGKKGRFRQNLLGKRVDYSGRSVIVIGPQLKIYQCGLPKQMALELFKPFVVRQLVDRGIAPNVKSAKRVIERGREEIWGILEEIIKDHPVMLNRAPTLHRLGIQAFEPVLMEGKAIRLHPMVCTAFNADFDGDQMAVHVPLSIEAQAEARLLMLSANNLLSPASGRPVVTPTQDIVLGIYYLTDMRDDVKGQWLHFSDIDDLLAALDHGAVHLNARVWLREDPSWQQRPTGRRKYRGEDGTPMIVQKAEEVNAPEGAMVFFETTPGRALFNRVIAPALCYVNYQLDKKKIGSLLDSAYDKVDRAQVVDMLDAVKALGYRWAARSGISFGVKSIIIPPEKAIITEATRAQDNIAKENYEMGLLTREEYMTQKGKLWGGATNEIASKVVEHMAPGNSVLMMVDSGARGSKGQMGQMAGIRGLMSDPTGRTIDYPITANFREGMNVLEYFISTHGARKGLADTALRTAKSGYLTRRLVDVAQDLIITEHDCGTDVGICIRPLTSEGKVIIPISERIAGRTALNDIVHPETGEMIVRKGDIITYDMAAAVDRSGLEEVWVRSPLACGLKRGVCQKCYGIDLSSRYLIPIGEAVGVVAAQSIGEPGTQLTMRTFHTGGVHSAEDITQGLPRIEQLFEVRRPRKVALLAGLDGFIEEIKMAEGKRRVIISSPDGTEKITHAIPSSQELREEITEGMEVSKMTQLTEGSIDPQQLLEVSGINAVQRMLVDEIQYVYQSQGVSINNKHIEVILRKVAPLNKVRVIEEGDTSFVAGDMVWLDEVEAAEREIREDNERYMAEAVRIFSGDILKSAERMSDEVSPYIGKRLDEESLKFLLTPGLMLTNLVLEHDGIDVDVVIGTAAFRRHMDGFEIVNDFKYEDGVIEAGTSLGKDHLRLITELDPSPILLRDRGVLNRLIGSSWLSANVVSGGELIAKADTMLTREAADAIASHDVREIKVWHNIDHINIADTFSASLMENSSVWGRSIISAADADGNQRDVPQFVDEQVIKDIVSGDISALETDSGVITRSSLFDRFLASRIKGKILLDAVFADGREVALPYGKDITEAVLKLLEDNDPVEIFVRGTAARSDTHSLMRYVTFVRKLRESPECRPFIHGVTKAALATDSFLSAASFQQTAQILAGAAVRGELDPLHGLKENVIIGHLIPAGTGSEPFRGFSVEISDEILTDEADAADSENAGNADAQDHAEGSGGAAAAEPEGPSLPDNPATIADALYDAFERNNAEAAAAAAAEAALKNAEAAEDTAVSEAAGAAMPEEAEVTA